MTERTFRSPSPNASQDRPDRPASSHGPYPRYDRNDAPPVPALPKDYVPPPHPPQVKDRRPASVEPPQRINSPPPIRSGGRGVSLDRGPGVMTPPATKAKTKRTLDRADESERAGGRSSVNFSRPMSPQNSPPNSPLAGGRIQSPPPTKAASATGLADGDADKISVPLESTTAAPVKKKRKAVAKGSTEGRNFAAGTSESPQSGTASDSTSQVQAPPTTSAMSPSTGLLAGDPSQAPLAKTKKKKKNAAQNDEYQAGVESFSAAYPSDSDSAISERGSTTDRPRSYNTRAAGLLAKQPSIVREDREGEEKAEEKLQGTKAKDQATSNGSALAGTSANTSKLVSKDRQHGRSSSQQAPRQAPKVDVTGTIRHTSLSPGRAAHFSAQPVNEGAKHQPPGRSVSPAKSALKNSPSRGHSPMVTRGGLAPSDASDSASQYSDDGSKSSSKKKKSARVSFDEEPVIVGRAVSPPLDPASPLIMSPQNKLAKPRTWIDLIREQNQGSIGSDQDDGSAIKPMPALPSFGSVRGRDQKPLSEVDRQVNPGEDRTQDTLQSMESSTDNAVGYIVVAEAAAKQTNRERPAPLKPRPNDPVPPEVTSVEGSGYQSDEGDLFNEQEETATPHPTPGPSQVPKSVSQFVPVASVDDPSSADVPSIAVQPATPGLESIMANRDSWLGMPGGFPSQKEGEGEPTSKADPAEHQTPATVGIAEPEPEAVAAQHHSSAPVVGEVAQTLRTQIDAASGDGSEDSAADSIYSDAAEDQSDLEGDGFGSINAIVESPTSPNIGLAGRSPPASPRRDLEEETMQPGPAKRKENELSEPAPSEGWDRAQAYWSGLSQTRKQQLEQAALPGAIDEPIIRDRSMRGADALQKKKKKRAKKAPPQPLGNSDVLQQTLAHPPKSSVPSSPPQIDTSPHLRSSMRNGSPKSAVKNAAKRSSMALPTTPKTALQKKNRPVSAVAMVDHKSNVRPSSPKHAQIASVPPLAVSKNQVPVQQQKHSPVARSKMQRANSDSDSSFKKARPKTPAVKRYTMKRSMRGQSDEPVPNRPSSMSARTASPVGSITRRPFNSIGPSGAGGMRTSMRGSVDVSNPGRTSLRNSMESGKANRTKSPSRFSFMSSSKAKSVTAESKPTSRFPSRFGDSSDEEGLPTMTSSRFPDSSDDDEDPAGLTPVRGIPRRINEGDSTDLDDSSEEKAAATNKNQAEVESSKNQQTSPVVSPEGAALATGSLRTPSGAQPPTPAMGTGLQAKKAAEKEKKKRNFFGSLSGRKREESSGVQKSEVGSPSRPETELERTRVDQMAVIPETSKSSGHILGPSSAMADPIRTQKTEPPSQTGSQTSIVQNSPKSPKLQRRNTPKRITSSNDISWPLSQRSTDPVDTPPRPRTSDGPAASNGDTRPRPSLVLRHSVQAPVRNPVMNGAASTSTDPTAKKKKFSMLRKAFGLHN